MVNVRLLRTLFRYVKLKTSVKIWKFQYSVFVQISLKNHYLEKNSFLFETKFCNCNKKPKFCLKYLSLIDLIVNIQMINLPEMADSRFGLYPNY